MRNDDADLLDCVIERLVAIRTRLGRHVFRDAGRRALSGIARAALAEGERRAARGRLESEVVAQFPLERARDGGEKENP
ncbi:MAG: hypothetical protein ABSC22_11025 [Roseiarcus sp.]|jgi:hypothetical protein